jgi:hypothetical protein
MSACSITLIGADEGVTIRCEGCHFEAGVPAGSATTEEISELAERHLKGGPVEELDVAPELHPRHVSTFTKIGYSSADAALLEAVNVHGNSIGE